MVKFINGPTNYVYLKGTINGVEKNIYFFMDTHNKLDNQTKCESFDSIDISHYLYKKIKNTSNPLDFFMEIRTSDISIPVTNKRDIYIEEVIKLFKTKFVIEKINDKDFVRYSKTNPNVRLHFLDIRDHLGLFIVMDIIKHDILETYKLLLNSNNNSNNIKYIEKFLQFLEQIKNKIEKLTKNKDKIINNTFVEYDKINNKQKYYLTKVIHKYENSDLKENIIKFINNNYNFILYHLNLALLDIQNQIKNWNLDFLDHKLIEKIIDFINEAIIDLYSLFTDAFLLRRILDKSYINRSIVYTGQQHSLNYIYFLIKYYDFKIINIYYIENDINEVVNKIKNTNYVFDIYKLFNLKKKERVQCINFDDLYIGGSRLKETLFK